MNNKFFKVRCTQCKQTMTYHTRDSSLKDKKKRCVYCGKTFEALKNII